MTTSVMLPSTAGPDKAWNIHFLKSANRPGYWSGVEVTITDRDPTTGKPTGYTFELFGNTRRIHSPPVESPATAKRKQAAYSSLLDTLRSQGLIAESQP